MNDFLDLASWKKQTKKLGWYVNKFNQLFSSKNVSVTAY